MAGTVDIIYERVECRTRIPEKHNNQGRFSVFTEEYL